MVTDDTTMSELEKHLGGDENLLAFLLEGWSLTQPCGSASELEDQILGAAGQFDLLNSNGSPMDDHCVLAIPPQRTSQSQRLAASFFEEPSPTQSCGSGSHSKNQLQFESSEGAGFLPAPASSSRGFNDLNTHGFLATADHGARLRNPPHETMNRGQPRRETKLANCKRHLGSNWASIDTPGCVIEGLSPTQPRGSGTSELENHLQDAAWQFESSENAELGLPGPSSSRGTDDFYTHGFLASARLENNPPQETMNRRRKIKREKINKRQRQSNWGLEETTCFLKHMETVVVAESHKPPWRAVSEAMQRDHYDRDKKAIENRWGVLLKAFKTDSASIASSSSRGLQLEWRESMMRILRVRPRVCRKLLRPAPPTPSPASGTVNIEEFSSLIAQKESMDDQIIRLLLKRNELENELLRAKTKPKTRKRKIRGGLGSDDDEDGKLKLSMHT